LSLPYPLDHYYRLLEGSSRLFLLLLVLASLVLLVTLALCAVVWYALLRRVECNNYTRVCLTGREAQV
jgi:hypothetical protein